MCAVVELHVGPQRPLSLSLVRLPKTANLEKIEVGRTVHDCSRPDARWKDWHVAILMTKRGENSFAKQCDARDRSEKSVGKHSSRTSAAMI